MPLAPKSSALGLTIYKGSWSAQQVKHLLNRTMLGAKASDIDYFTSKGLNASVDELLNCKNCNKLSPYIYCCDECNNEDYCDKDSIS